MKMKTRFLPVALFLMLALSAGCNGGDDGSQGSGGDADSDGDSDVGDSGGEDAGADSDVDGDTDSDTDTDGDGDTDSDTDADGDADCPILPADNPWNTDISAYPLHPDSDNFIQSIGADGYLHPDFGTEWDGAPIGMPFVIVPGDQPKVDIEFGYADESDPGPYPIPDDAPIEGGPDSDGDRHVLVLDQDNCLLYETWSTWPPGTSGNEASDPSHWYAGSGAKFDLRSNTLRPEGWTSADAAGLPIYPGLVRYDEVVEKKAINHALRFTVSASQQGYIHPATHFASSDTNPNLPPMGLRLRMKASYDCSGYSEEVRVICTALKKYGMIVADNGSDWYISGSHDDRWNDDNLGDLKSVPGSAFEVVDTGEIITK